MWGPLQLLKTLAFSRVSRYNNQRLKSRIDICRHNRLKRLYFLVAIMAVGTAILAIDPLGIFHAEAGRWGSILTPNHPNAAASTFHPGFQQCQKRDTGDSKRDQFASGANE